jgi:TolA-binding protein
MKIYKEKLNQIINEEIKAVLSESTLTNLARAVIPPSGQAVNLGSPAKPSNVSQNAAAKTVADDAAKTVAHPESTEISSLIQKIRNAQDLKQSMMIVRSLVDNVVIKGLEQIHLNAKIDPRSQQAISDLQKRARNLSGLIKSVEPRLAELTVAQATAAMPDATTDQTKTVADKPKPVAKPVRGAASPPSKTNPAADAMRSGGSFSGRGYRE